MATKEYAGKTVNVSEDGYFTDASQWSREVAADMAKEVNLELTETHYKVLEFIRDKYNTGGSLTIRSIGKSGIASIKEFYKLFPGAPLKKATLLAGIPKPASCI